MQHSIIILQKVIVINATLTKLNGDKLTRKLFYNNNGISISKRNEIELEAARKGWTYTFNQTQGKCNCNKKRTNIKLIGLVVGESAIILLTCDIFK